MGVSYQPFHLSRKIGAGLRPEAKGTDVAVESLFLQGLANLDDADIAGDLYHLFKTEPSMGMNITNGVPTQSVGAFLAEDFVFQLEESLFQASGSCNNLECGARFKGISNGSVPTGTNFTALKGVRVEGGSVGQS